MEIWRPNDRIGVGGHEPTGWLDKKPASPDSLSCHSRPVSTCRHETGTCHTGNTAQCEELETPQTDGRTLIVILSKPETVPCNRGRH